MADGRSRINSGDGRNSASRSRGSSARSAHVITDIRSKEDEYKRLNDELEAKTANLVKEAEQVLRNQEEALSKSRLLGNINTDDFLKEFDDDLAGRNEDVHTKPPSRPTSKQNSSRSSSRNKSNSARGKTKGTAKMNQDEDGATFMTEDISLTERILQMEQTIGDDDDMVADDILPHTAADMGTEATIRFLKAKLRVMQEEMDKLAQDMHTKEEECRTQTQKVKELEDERGRHVRTIGSQQTQIDKYKKMADDARAKSDSAENQLSALRKEVEQLKRGQKQEASTHSITEVRLNRALEEVERYKEQLHKAKTSSKDASVNDKKKVEQLISDNKRLEKQKNELMAGFKKQLKLIDILKRQKMHIEAAKMLQFSEEEFVKALEWGN